MIVSEAPVAEEHHKDRCPLKEVECSVVQRFIVHWRALEEVSNQNGVDNVQVEESERSDWEEDRQSHPVHKCDPNSVQNGRILVEDQVVGTRVERNVLLLGDALGLLALAAAANAAVTPFGELAEEQVNGEVNVYVNRVDLHSINECWSDSQVPVLREVRVGTSEWKPPDNCSLCVRTRKQQQYCRVEEGRYKDGKEDTLCLARFGMNADFFD